MKKAFFYFMLLTFSISVCAQPKVVVQHQRSAKDLAEIKVTNQTIEALICYVAIDGHRLYFRLAPNQPSHWYTATDSRLNFSNFSTWCDYLYLHPQYMPKKK
jgi:hypothetical protein